MPLLAAASNGVIISVELPMRTFSAYRPQIVMFPPPDEERAVKSSPGLRPSPNLRYIVGPLQRSRSKAVGDCAARYELQTGPKYHDKVNLEVLFLH